MEKISEQKGTSEYDKYEMINWIGLACAVCFLSSHGDFCTHVRGSWKSSLEWVILPLEYGEIKTRVFVINGQRSKKGLQTLKG